METDVRTGASTGDGGRGLLAGGGLLAVGWGLTELLARRPTAVPGDPVVGALALWLAAFGLVAAVAVTRWGAGASPPVLVWTGLNAVGFLYAGLSATGLVPVSATRYAYWHVWVAVSVVGFGATGALVERAGGSGQVYYTAAGLELSLLILGLAAFDELAGPYLLLAFVHPTPLLLDGVDPDLDPGPTAAVQLAAYAAGLGLVLLG